MWINRGTWPRVSRWNSFVPYSVGGTSRQTEANAKLVRVLQPYPNAVNNPQRLRLPIGIQTFSDIREQGYYYVDKTRHIEQLVDQNKYCFLSRPRRFGKSLLLDTIRCLFEGRRELFSGLSIEPHWNWQTNHPVIRISFSDGLLQDRQALDERIRDQLHVQRERLGVKLARKTDIAGEFAALIRDAHKQYGVRAVVLIDEYDKPILDNILEPVRARELREGLKNFYSTLKDADPDLRFVMLTGVSKFSKVSLFSGLNNLNDITLDAPYATICGYTDIDIDAVFAPELKGLDRQMIRTWYNGYRWGSAEVESIYNPFDVLLLLQKRQFGPYWFESATPGFLVDLLKDRGVFTPKLDRWETEYELINQFDVDEMTTEGLLFQTGYLTIKSIEEPMVGYRQFILGLPNREVEASLNYALLPSLGLAHEPRQRKSLFNYLQQHDLTGIESHLRALFASLPHDWYRNNPIARYEGHYASVFYSHFSALGLNVTVEDASHMGSVDMCVDFDGHIYLFEFKVIEQSQPGSALAQILQKRYADKYLASGKTIHLVGIEFSGARRQIEAFEVQTLAAH